MTLLETFRALGYLWPGQDGAANVLGTSGQPQLRGLVAHYFKELRQTHGAEAVALAFKLYGNEATFEQLEHVKAQQEALLARQSETPNLLPLFGPALRFGRVAQDVSSYRTHALKKGLTPAGWRWLARQARPTVQKLAGNGLAPKAIAWINLLAQVGEALPARLATPSGVLGLSDLDDQVTGALLRPQQYEVTAKSLVTFMRLALRTYAQAETNDARTTFMGHYGLLVVEQVRRVRQNLRFIVPGSTWTGAIRQMEETVRRRMEEAARLRAITEADDAERKRWRTARWESAVREHTRHGINVVPLCTNDELVEEGAILDHCVGNGTYLPLCVNGLSRIFALKGNHSAFRATLQLVHHVDGTWAMAQLKTFGNATPPAIFHKVAREVCEAYNQKT